MARKSYKRGRSRKFRGRRGGGIAQLFGAPYPSCAPDKQRYDNCQKIARQAESSGKTSVSSVSTGFGLGSLMTPAASVPLQNNYASQNYASPNYSAQNYAAPNDIETGMGSSSGYGQGAQQNYGAQEYQGYGGGSRKQRRKHRRTNKKRYSRRRR